MIEITIGSLEDRIIKLLRRTYPITTFEIAQKLQVSQREIEWLLKKFQIKGIVKLDILPDKIYVRLLRSDFRFSGSKQQRRTIKHTIEYKKPQTGDCDEIMYS